MSFPIENVTQYDRNVTLPQVNVSRVNTALVILSCEEVLFVFGHKVTGTPKPRDICFI